MKKNRNQMPDKYLGKWNDVLVTIAPYFILMFGFTWLMIIVGLVAKYL